MPPSSFLLGGEPFVAFEHVLGKFGGGVEIRVASDGGEGEAGECGEAFIIPVAVFLLLFHEP